MAKSIAQFSRHFVWWCVIALILPLIFGFGSLLLPSAHMKSFGIETIWTIFLLPIQLLGPHLGAFGELVPGLALVILFYAGSCLLLAAVTVLLANSALLTDAYQSALRALSGAAKRGR